MPHRFALLVPCHNAVRFLPRLWETVRSQTRPSEEWICHDDASTDETAEVARSLGAQVIHGQTNIGPVAARNPTPAVRLPPMTRPSSLAPSPMPVPPWFRLTGGVGSFRMSTRRFRLLPVAYLWSQSRPRW